MVEASLSLEIRKAFTQANRYRFHTLQAQIEGHTRQLNTSISDYFAAES